MIYIDVDVNTWRKKHHIIDDDPNRPCVSCDGQYSIARPFRTKDYAGIEYSCPNCPPEKYSSLLMVAVSKEKKAEWKYIFDNL